MRRSVKKMVIPPAVCLLLLSPLNPVKAQEANSVAIDEVEVHSTALVDYLVTTEVITADKIKEMGATNLAEAISKVPGLYVSYAGKGSRLVRIRGAASDQTKVYVDGMPVFPLSGIASNSASNLETIPVENIEKIEIIKGPGPVQYGTDYKGGVILITTKKGQGNGQTSVHLSTGSHNSFDNYLTYSGSDNNASYYFTGGKKKSDGHLRNSEFDTDFFDGKIKWNVSKNSAITLSGYYMNTDREIPNGINQNGTEQTSSIKWSGFPTTASRNTTDWKYTDFKQTNVALQFDRKVSQTFKYNVKIYHVTDGNDLWVKNIVANPTALVPLWYRSGWYSKGNGMEFTGDILADMNQTVTFGVKYNNIDWNTNENITDLDERGTDKRIGYFIQDSIKFGDKTNVTLGVRYDEAKQSYSYFQTNPTNNTITSYRNSSTVDSTDPVFNITHQLDEKNTLRLSAGKTHIFVTAKQASSNIQAGSAIPAPEKATNYELGWAHNFDDKSSVDMAVFVNKITDRIDRITKNDPYINIAKTNIRGVELQYNRNFTERLKGFVNYTYLEAKDTDVQGVESKSLNLPDAMFNYGVTYTVNQFQTTLLGHYVGDISNTGTTPAQLASYHTVDLEFKYQKNEKTDYFLRVNNLFDTKYWETATYPGDGINFLAGVNIKL